MESSQDDSPGNLPQQPSVVPENAYTIMNLALVDPPRWGWTAFGPLVDLLPPHEVSRLARRADSSGVFVSYLFE